MAGLLWAAIATADSAMHRMDNARQPDFGVAQDHIANHLESLYFTVDGLADRFSIGLSYTGRRKLFGLRGNIRAVLASLSDRRGYGRHGRSEETRAE